MMNPHFHDKRVFVLSLVAGEMIVFFVGLYMQGPFMFYLSGIAFVLSFIAVFYDNTTLNTFVIALTPFFIGMLANVFITINLDTMIHAIMATNIMIVTITRWRFSYPILIPFCAVLYIFIILTVKLYFDQDFIGYGYYANFDTRSVIYILIFDSIITIFIFYNDTNTRKKLKQFRKKIRSSNIFEIKKSKIIERS